MKMLHGETYGDVIEEFVRSLLRINAMLFLSRINEFSEYIRETAARYAPEYSSGVSC